MPRRRQPGSAADRASIRPRLSLIAPGASPEEAAAIVAALERYVRDTTPPQPPPGPPAPGRWLRAALTEGVSRGADRPGGSWGNPRL